MMTDRLSFVTAREILLKTFSPEFEFKVNLSPESYKLIENAYEMLEIDLHYIFILDATLVMNDWSNHLANYIAYEYIHLNYSNIQEYMEELQFKVLPFSNRESFCFLMKLDDKDLGYALNDLTTNREIIVALLNAIKDEDYIMYKTIIENNKLSSYNLNYKLRIYNILKEQFWLLSEQIEAADQNSNTDDYGIERAYLNNVLNSIDPKIGTDFNNMINSSSENEFLELFSSNYRRLLSFMKYIVDSVKDSGKTYLNPYTRDITGLQSSIGYQILTKWDIPAEINDEKLINGFNEFNPAMRDYIHFLQTKKDFVSKQRVGETTCIENNQRDNRHLEFPTRFLNEVEPKGIAFDEREAILKDIYELLCGSFNGMTSEDFVYLFNGSNNLPDTYNVPYYWSGDESTMKAILRIFYERQHKLVRSLILHSSDKQSGATEHNWGKNKKAVAYLSWEKKIIDIIKKCTGKTLKSL